MNEIKNPVTLLGVTFSRDDLKSWKNFFEEVEFGDRIRLVSKEIFEQDPDDNEPFGGMKYRYVVLGETGSETGYTIRKEDGEEVDADYYSLYLVPVVACVPDSKIKDVASTFGFEDEPVEKLRTMLTEVDLVEYGLGVFLGEYDKESSDQWDEDALNGFATIVPSIDFMRGFWLDRPMNAVGMTGWDFLEMSLTEKSFRDFI